MFGVKWLGSRPISVRTRSILTKPRSRSLPTSPHQYSQLPTVPPINQTLISTYTTSSSPPSPSPLTKKTPKSKPSKFKRFFKKILKAPIKHPFITLTGGILTLSILGIINPALALISLYGIAVISTLRFINNINKDVKRSHLRRHY